VHAAAPVRLQAEATGTLSTETRSRSIGQHSTNRSTPQSARLLRVRSGVCKSLVLEHGSPVVWWLTVAHRRASGVAVARRKGRRMCGAQGGQAMLSLPSRDRSGHAAAGDDVVIASWRPLGKRIAQLRPLGCAQTGNAEADAARWRRTDTENRGRGTGRTATETRSETVKCRGLCGCLAES
jgi:hypothetical protein